MPRARNKKSKPARKRAAKRRKAVVQESQTNWQIGAGIFALAALLGAGVYMISTNMEARTTVAELVERFEVPQAVKDFPDKVKQQLPEMPSITNASGPNESAPARAK